MSVAKIYSKGQVTIPKAIREATGIDVGDRVVVEARGNEIVLHRPRGVLEFRAPSNVGPTAPQPDARAIAREERAVRRTRRG